MAIGLILILWGFGFDPLNKDHIVFGGAENGSEQTMQLYETYNEGALIYRYAGKMDLTNPQVSDIVTTNTYPAILLNDQKQTK